MTLPRTSVAKTELAYRAVSTINAVMMARVLSRVNLKKIQ